MSDASSVKSSQYIIDSLREYVLAPLSAATRLINQERTEVETERDGFKEFRERIISLDPVTTPSNKQTTGRTLPTTSDQFDCVRSAYRETVMSTPHHEKTYTCQLVEDLAEEFGPEVAAGIRQSSSTQFTPVYKNILEAKTRNSINARNEFLDTLAEEAESVEDSRSGICQAINTLDRTVIPEWHCESFSEQLDRIGKQRQQTLQTRGSVSHLDEFTLCTYLYNDQPWRYPVLTGLARLRETVTFESDPETDTDLSDRLD